MTLPGHRSLTQHGGVLSLWLRVGWLVVSCLALSGCSSITLNAVVEGRLVAGGPIPGVEVIRQGVRSPVQDNMGLQPGDEIRTGPQTIAVLSFIDGARVFVQPGTHIRIGSVFVYFGEVLVKVRGYFQVETRYATAGSEGTQYLVRVDPGDQVRVVVAEGRVGLVSRSRGWNKAILGVGQGAWLVGLDAPVGFPPATPSEIEDIRRRIQALDALVPQPAELGPLLGGGAAVGAGIGLGWLLKDKHRDDAERSPTDPPRGRGRVPVPQDATSPPVRDPHREDADRSLTDSLHRRGRAPVEQDQTLTPGLRPKLPSAPQDSDRLR
jgi:hypothetical protein